MDNFMKYEQDGFMRDLTGLNKYITLDERILAIGISGISGINEIGGQVESISHKKTSSEMHNKTWKINRQYKLYHQRKLQYMKI
jgi:hypothetical protein